MSWSVKSSIRVFKISWLMVFSCTAMVHRVTWEVLNRVCLCGLSVTCKWIDMFLASLHNCNICNTCSLGSMQGKLDVCQGYNACNFY